MTYDEIIAYSEATKNNHGMSPEEIERRQAVIRQVAQHNPELARDMANGPYRINGGSGPTQPQGQVYRPLGRGQQYQQVPAGAGNAGSADIMQSPRITPNQGVATKMDTPSAPPVQGPLTRSGQYGFGPQSAMSNPDYPGSPSYRPPASSQQPQAQSSQPVININIGGPTQPAGFSRTFPEGQAPAATYEVPTWGPPPGSQSRTPQPVPQFPQAPQYPGMGLNQPGPYVPPGLEVPYNQSQEYWDRRLREQTSGIPPYTMPQQFGTLSR